ncbi:MAG TPA: enoyl-CoA hydratase/isomerase family protein [Syntrophales bacterium]|nr:enoyl-CoA hydratase/isomerase family protein [Syntrophales bacterium]
MAVLEWRKEESVAVITLTNGENRHNPDFTAAFLRALDEIEKDPGVSSVVIVSSDPKSWSQGIDLAWITGKMQQKDIPAIRDFMYGINNVFKRVLLYPMPVIACLNGHAAANGAILACACDFRFMRADRGFFFFPEIDIGIPFLPGMLAFLKKAIPYDTFNEMALTGKRYTAGELAACGVFTKACENEEALIAETMAFAKSLRKKRGVFGEMKRRLHAVIVEIIDKEDPKVIEPLKLFWKD